MLFWDLGDDAHPLKVSGSRGVGAKEKGPYRFFFLMKHSVSLLSCFNSLTGEHKANPMKALHLSLLFAVGLIGNATADVFTGDLNDGLVVYYPFNGDANDYSGNGNNLVLFGQTSFASVNLSNNDQALYVDENSGGVSLYPIGLTGKPTHTISLWNYINSEPEWPKGQLVGWGNSAVAQQESLKYVPWTASKVGENETLSSDGYFANAYVLTDPSSLIGNWHQITYVFNAIDDPNNPSRFYLDGILQSNNISYLDIQNLNIQDSPLFVNGEFQGEYGVGINGSISDLRIYNRALSQNEVTALYTLQSAPESSTYALSGIGAIGMLLVMRRKKAI